MKKKTNTKLKRRIRLGSLVAVLLLVFTLVMGLTHPRTAEAATASSGTWLDRSTIVVNIDGKDTKFFDSANDNDFTYYRTNNPGGCSKDYIDSVSNGNKSAHLVTFKQVSSTNSNCSKNVNNNFTLNDAPKSNNYFVWVNGSEIDSSDGRKSYILNKDGVFAQEGDTPCTDSFQASAGNPTNGTLIVRSTKSHTSSSSAEDFVIHDDQSPYAYQLNGGASFSYMKSEDGCPTVVKVTNVALGHTQNAKLAQTDKSQKPGGGATDGGSGANQATCNSTGSPLSWIVCPIINGIADGAYFVFDNIIRPLLIGNPVSTNPTDPQFLVWAAFRNIANVLLIVFLLVAVYAQATGGGLIDAYTAKKILPRVLVAAILLNLSIYIVNGAIDVTNILGKGMAQLIYLPFNQAGQGSFDFSVGAFTSFGIIATIAGSAGTIWGLASIGALGALAWPVIQAFLLFILLPTVLALIGVFVTLVLRQALLIFLTLSAPVAFALYCLPNTEQYFKRWWNLLFKTLLVYPIVMAIFAISSVLPSILEKTGNGGDILIDFVQILCLILPLFLIPFAFKLAGGAIGTLYGTLGGWNKRGAEAIKGNVNDPHSLRNSTKRKLGSAVTGARTRGYTALKSKSTGETDKVDSEGNKIRRRRPARWAAVGASKVIGYGNVEAKRASMNDEVDKIVSAQYSQGDDANIRAFWARQHTGPDQQITDENGKVLQTLRTGSWYSPYQNNDGTYKEWSAVDVSKARSIVGRDPSVVQSYGKYELGKDRNQKQVKEFKDRFAEIANDFNWSADEANGVWAGIKFSHQQTRKEEKHTVISKDPETGKLTFNTEGKKVQNGQVVIPTVVYADDPTQTPVGLKHGDVAIEPFSEELADAVRNFDYANFRPGTAEAALEGYLRATQGDLANSPDAAVIQRNFREIATGLVARIRSNQSIMPNEDGDLERGVSTGVSTGGSARADAEWKRFVETVLPGSLPGDSSGGSGRRGSPGGGNNSGSGTPPPAGPPGGPLPPGYTTSDGGLIVRRED